MIHGSKILGLLLLSAASAAATNTPADRWVELAAAHQPAVCTRCSPPANAGSVADVLRRMRHEDAPRAAAKAERGDVAAELKHVAAAPVDDRDRLAMRIADDLARGDLRTAASFAAALPPDRVQHGVMLVVVYRWMYHDRRAALDWAQALPEEKTRAVAVHEVTRHLVAADPRGALALVSGLPDGPGRTAALAAAVRHWANVDRDAALAWVHELTASGTKTMILKTLDE